MDVEAVLRMNDDSWLSEPFLDLGGSSSDLQSDFFFPASNSHSHSNSMSMSNADSASSDSSHLHSPIFTDVSDSTSESGMVLVRSGKRKADSEKSGSSRNGERETEQRSRSSQSREHSQESDSQHGVDEVVQKSRKGHKKSRQGCFNCKKRKIKVCSSILEKGIEILNFSELELIGV